MVADQNIAAAFEGAPVTYCASFAVLQNYAIISRLQVAVLVYPSNATGQSDFTNLTTHQILA